MEAKAVRCVVLVVWGARASGLSGPRCRTIGPYPGPVVGGLHGDRRTR